LAGPTTATFNLTSPGQEFLGWNASFVQNVGVSVLDFNGDGRQDILRWKDDPTQNALYLSNGDGSFTPSSTFNLWASTVQLRKSDGTASFELGDFTGRG